MRRFFTSELFFAILAVAVTVLLLATRDVDMSMTTQSMMLSLFAVAVLMYSAFIYKEKPADEREYELSLIASKHAYIAGAALISAGIIYQVIDHSLDVWLPVILAAMVSVKTISYYLQNK